MTGRLRRSALYMPGSNERALQKARDLPADALIFDLEDAVASGAKETARRQVQAAVSARDFGHRELVIRVNGNDTSWWADDIAAAAQAAPDAVLVPKVQRAADVIAAQQALDAAKAPARVRLWAMMETPRAVLDALSVAETVHGGAPRLEAFVIGTNDLAKDTRLRPGRDRALLLPWLLTLLAAGRAAGLAVLDGVFNGLDDGEGFVAECRQARDLGMDGKTLIHPKQIGPCHEAFRPSPQELEWAHRIVAAFDDPANAGLGAIRVEGQMVEQLHLAGARRDIAMGGG